MCKSILTQIFHLKIGPDLCISCFARRLLLSLDLQSSWTAKVILFKTDDLKEVMAFNLQIPRPSFNLIHELTDNEKNPQRISTELQWHEHVFKVLLKELSASPTWCITSMLCALYGLSFDLGYYITRSLLYSFSSFKFMEFCFLDILFYLQLYCFKKWTYCRALFPQLENCCVIQQIKFIDFLFGMHQKYPLKLFMYNPVG